jgi:membrane-bound lytic murein transglycosylase D
MTLPAPTLPTVSWRALPAALAIALLSACTASMPIATAPEADPPAEAATPAPEPVATPEPTPEAPAETAAEPVATVDPTTTTGREVFDRIRARLRTPACVDSPRARQWQSRYAKHPTVLARRIEGVLPLLDFVVAETERSGLPGEFVFIPLVESWYEPGAVGRGGPTGMWQMIGSTARNHGVGIRKGYDGRLSPVDSTRAALSYLKTLNGMFGGDWQATVMAYNGGEYRLLGALRRSGSRRVEAAQGVPGGLSPITYDYVSKLQALSCLVTEPQRFGLRLPDETRFERLAPLLVDGGVRTLEQVAARTGVAASQLRAWNPAYRSGRIVDGAPRLLLMPMSASGRLGGPDTVPESTAASPVSAGVDGPGSATHEVRSGDTLSRIAQQYGVTLKALRDLNRLGKSSVIRPGQVLRLVP